VVPPKLHGQPLKVARRAILKWHCRPGKVVLVWSKTVFKGRVIGARPHAGTHLKAGAHITMVVSKGKKPKTRTAPKGAHARGGNAVRVA
jgi:serine/threonine-protein kinase